MVMNVYIIHYCGVRLDAIVAGPRLQKACKFKKQTKKRHDTCPYVNLRVMAGEL